MQTNGGLSGKNSRAAKPRFAFAIAVLSRADNRLIGYQLHPKLLEQKPGNRSGASGARSCLSRFGFVACHFIDPSRERVIAPGGGKNRLAIRARNRLRRIPGTGFHDQPRTLANESCRLRNSSARAR